MGKVEFYGEIKENKNFHSKKSFYKKNNKKVLFAEKRK